jgi:hypothetical protein
VKASQIQNLRSQLFQKKSLISGLKTPKKPNGVAPAKNEGGSVPSRVPVVGNT